MQSYNFDKIEWEVENPNKNVFSKVQIHAEDTLIIWSKSGAINFWKQKKEIPLLEINAKQINNPLDKICQTLNLTFDELIQKIKITWFTINFSIF